MDYVLPRGTKDILPKEAALWQYIEQTARQIFSLYQFSEIRTPIFESSALFNRVIGEASDIIQKEMYTFTDKGGRNLALRPEGTAPIARAFVTNGLKRQASEHKLYYIGPMFRYERPQAGRYRQFHQIGLESIGSGHPYTDAEVIVLAYRLFTTLGLKNVKIHINSVGSETCRPVIEARIKQFLASNIHQLSDNLKEKFEKNPLKMLDSKDKMLQTYLAGLPDLREALSQESKDHFNLVLEYLDQLDIPFEYKPSLVRGLDYYTETVFEVVSDDLGAQNSICGGGRYNQLIKDIGGPETPAVGFAFGLERLLMLMENQGISIPDSVPLVYVAPLGVSYQLYGAAICEELRDCGFKTIMDYSKSDMNSHIKRANKQGAHYMVLFGDQEHESQEVLIKHMQKRSQDNIKRSELSAYFTALPSLSHV